MKSIAIWYKPINTAIELPSDVELHFNLWKIPNGSAPHIRFLDIGIKLSQTDNIDFLNLYFPHKLNIDEVEDIVHKFIDKADLVSAIFNENYKVVSIPGSKLYEIKDINDQGLFGIYKTSSNDVILKEEFGGSVINIKVPKRNRPVYFRFRIKGSFISALTSTYKPTNAIFESAFSEIEMFDFRVNEARDLDQDLLEKIKSERSLRIKKQHFFFICSNEEDIVGHHQPYLSCRNLENYRWSGYVGLPNMDSQIYLAYHWKDKDLDNSSILIKSKYEKNNWRTIGIYAIIAFIIAVSIELISNWLYDTI